MSATDAPREWAAEFDLDPDELTHDHGQEANVHVPTSGLTAELDMPVRAPLDMDVEVASEPYPLPDLGQQPDVRKGSVVVEVQLPAPVATVRDVASQRIANLGTDNKAHFITNNEGREVCGSCGQAFPCATYRNEIVPRDTATSLGDVAASVEEQRKVENVATLLGISMERAREVVRETGGGL